MMNQTNISDACQRYHNEENAVCNYLVLPALFLTIALSFLGKRKTLCTHRCGGRPVVLSPIDFLEEDRRCLWIYLACFALFIRYIQNLFNKKVFWTPAVFHEPEWMVTYPFVSVLVIMMNLAQVCVILYPLMVCVKLHKHILANLAGLGYLSVFIWRLIAGFLSCPFLKLNDDVNKNEEIIENSVSDVPRVLGIVVLLVAYTVDLGTNIRSTVYKYKQKKENDIRCVLMEENSEPEDQPHYVEYVKELLKRKSGDTSDSYIIRIINKLKYTNIKGFRYSPRLICTVVVSLFILIVTSSIPNVWYTEIIIPIFHNAWANTTSDGKDLINTINTCCYIGNCGSLLLQFTFLLRTVTCYRQNMLMYYRGDRSWHHRRRYSPMLAVTGSMKFPGFQIAYMVYGFYFVMILLMCVSLGLAFTLILPLKHGSPAPLINLIERYWPLAAISVIIYLVQVMLARFVFLQSPHNSLALNNRHVLNVFSYFMFFYNFILGLFSGVKRIFFSNVMSIIWISRIDRCLTVRGIEYLDPGFTSYLGMLQFEMQHNHPVMRAFVHLLWKSVHQKRMRMLLEDGTEHNALIPSFPNVEENGFHNIQYATNFATRRRQRIRNKWFKAFTLLRNPSIKSDDTGTNAFKARQHPIEKICDQLGACTSVCCVSHTSDIDGRNIQYT